MKKEDRRTTYTKTLIKDTVLSLLQKKPISKITVSEVCQIADINRGTFYLHYKDSLDVLEQLQDEYCDRVIALLEEHKDLNELDIILKLHQFNNENADDYLIFIRTDLPTHSFKKLTDYGKNQIVDYICSNSSLTRAEAEWVSYYIVSASIGITQRYTHDIENAKHREEVLQRFVGGGLKAIFDTGNDSSP